MLLLPASEALGELIPKPLSQISPAAVPSIADWAEDPPSPENTKVPIASEPIDTEWLSKGPLPIAVSSPWSITNDNDIFKPPSVSPEPEKVNWFPIVQALPVVFEVFFTPILAEPATDISAAFAEKATREPAKADNPIFLMFILITPLINC